MSFLFYILRRFLFVKLIFTNNEASEEFLLIDLSQPMYKVEYLDSRFTRVHTEKINKNVPLKVLRIFSIRLHLVIMISGFAICLGLHLLILHKF